jgi:DNA-binding transcriptional ArsR family regulator
VIRIAPPEENARWDERIAFASLPLADCLLALWMIANGQSSLSDTGGERLAALADRLTMSQTRAVTEQLRDPFPLGMLLKSVAALHDGGDVAALLAVLQALPEYIIVGDALHAAGELTVDAPRGFGVWLSLMADAAWARDYLRRFIAPAPADPERLLAIIAHPSQTRDRLVDLIHDLTGTVIEPLLPELLTISKAADARLREDFAHSPEEFATSRVPLEVRAGAVERALFWPSAFLGNGSVTITIDAPPMALIAYGAEEPSRVPRAPAPVVGVSTDIAPAIAPPETYQDVYRLLADPVRWSLIQLLVTAPRYGQELAELLGLSIATISHHLNGLKKLDLVDIRREEHRLYYHLRTDRLRALLSGAEQRLLR